MWHTIFELKIIAHSYLRSMQVFGQETVVVASPTSDTMTVVVESDAGNENQVNRSMESVGLRFRHSESPLPHHLLAVIRTYFY
jgi:hypothetical protein